jgi:hypothetical protein
MWRCCSVLLLAVTTPAYSFQASYYRPTLLPSALCNCNSESRSVPTPARKPVHRQQAVLQMASSGAPKQKAAKVVAANDAVEILKAGNQAALPDEGAVLPRTLLMLVYSSYDRQSRMQQRARMVTVLTLSHFASIFYCPHFLHHIAQCLRTHGQC